MNQNYRGDSAKTLNVMKFNPCGNQVWKRQIRSGPQSLFLIFETVTAMSSALEILLWALPSLHLNYYIICVMSYVIRNAYICIYT